MHNTFSISIKRASFSILALHFLLTGCQQQPTADAPSDNIIGEQSSPQATDEIDYVTTQLATGTDENTVNEAPEQVLADTIENMAVTIEKDNLVPEQFFDHENSIKNGEAYTETVFPKKGSHPTLAGFPIASYDTLYYEQWIGCCPRATIDVLLVDEPTANQAELESYATTNECEIRTINATGEDSYSYKDIERQLTERGLPVADNYIQLMCRMDEPSTDSLS